MASGSVETVMSVEDFESAIARGKPVIVHFWASWCRPSQQMDEVLAQLSADTPQATFLRVEAEEQADISEKYGVATVPYFVFLKDGKVVDKLEGVNPAALAHKVAKLVGPPSSSQPSSLGMSAAPSVLEAVQKAAPPNVTLTKLSKKNTDTNNASDENLDEDKKVRLEKLVNSNAVMVFMKGKPEEPKCGFSRKVVDALKNEGIEFGSFDILQDEEVRQGLKVMANWPTYPQVYSNGELVGGCDIILELQKSGELKQSLVA